MGGVAEVPTSEKFFGLWLGIKEPRIFFGGCHPPSGRSTRCVSGVITRKMPKIAISGIAVLAVPELRDRFWDGIGLI